VNVYAVRYETRDSIGRIVEEIDSLYLDRDAAHARKAEINGDPVKFPNVVAWVHLYHASTAGAPGTAIAHCGTVTVTNPGEKRRNPRGSKLTENDVGAIRAKYATGYTLLDLSREYHVRKQTISDVVRRKTWKEV
jgi:hypothetical protein